MTARTVSIEATKRKLYRRLAEEFGERPLAVDDEPQPETDAPFIHVEFTDRRPSHILPILGVVTEYGQGIAAITHNLGTRR